VSLGLGLGLGLVTRMAIDWKEDRAFVFIFQIIFFSDFFLTASSYFSNMLGLGRAGESPIVGFRFDSLFLFESIFPARTEEA
jgi:hypothetical protein